MTISIQGAPWRAVIFDRGGVVMDAAAARARTWKPLCDGYLARRSGPDADGSSR